MAQQNILSALTEANANFAERRREVMQMSAKFVIISSRIN
jgi:hypothetical protein